MRKLWHDRVAARVALGAVLPALVVLCWHVASRRSVVVPTIAQVWDVLSHPLRDPPNLDSKPLCHSVLISLLRVSLGYALAAATAVPIGLAVGRWLPVRRLVSPLVELLRPICPIAWLPPAIIVFGFSSLGSTIWGEDAWRHELLGQMQWAMIAIIWWGAFFPILLNTVHGVETVRGLYIEAARMLGADEWQIFWKTILPASLPSIVTGLRVGMGIAWMVIVAAEIFPGTRAGLGYMITTSHQVAEYEYAFACIIVIGCVGLAVNFAFKALSDHVGRWQVRER